jgi:hypothetical protein
MDQPRPFLKKAVIVWSIVLGLLFIIGYRATVVLGTKSNGTFQYVRPGPPP